MGCFSENEDSCYVIPYRYSFCGSVNGEQTIPEGDTLVVSDFENRNVNDKLFGDKNCADLQKSLHFEVIYIKQGVQVIRDTLEAEMDGDGCGPEPARKNYSFEET